MKFTVADLKSWGVQSPEKFLTHINKYSEEFEINTPIRILGFWANVLHESGNLFYMREIASGVQYEGRKDLGNTSPGDGKKYAGRGLIQITGKNNYIAFNDWYSKKYNTTKYNFVKNPELIETPEFAVLAAFWFWEANKLSKWADDNKFKEVCSIINTGGPNAKKINGINDRLEKYKIINTWLKSLL